MKKEKFTANILIISLLLLAILFCLAGCGGGGGGGGEKAPSAPGTPLLTSADNQLTVTWLPVSRATSYEVWYHTENDRNAAGRFTGDSNETDISSIITGLDNEKTYFVWVKAKNSAGTSGFSPPANGIPKEPTAPPETPGQPILIAGDGQLTATWSPVTSAAEYEIWYHETFNSDDARKFTGDSDKTDTTCVITDLTNGITYFVWVKAINSFGSSNFSLSANGKPKNSSEPNVSMKYIVGNYCTVGTFDYKACYWIGQQKHDLDTANSSLSFAHSIFVSGTTLYFAGCYYTGSTGATTNYPCYWSNISGAMQAIALGSDSGSANSITLMDSFVYIAGYFKKDGVKHACYWSNESGFMQRKDLEPTATEDSEALSIAVSGSSKYIAGSYRSSNKNHARLWTDKTGSITKTDLSPSDKHSFSHWLYVSSSTIYLTGYEAPDSGSTKTAYYWKVENGVMTSSNPLPGINAEGTSIFVEGSTIYVAGAYGSTNKIACYWSNKTGSMQKNDLESETGVVSSFINMIFVLDSDVYMAGNYTVSGSPAKACYWKVGEGRIDLGPEGKYSEALGLFVK